MSDFTGIINENEDDVNLMKTGYSKTEIFFLIKGF